MFEARGHGGAYWRRRIQCPDTGIRDTAAALEYAERVIQTVKEPVSIEGNLLTVTLSIGIAMYPDDGRESAELQRQADAACITRRASAKTVYSASPTARFRSIVCGWNRNWARALQEGWFTVHYQPKFTAEENYLAGMEALVRMNHPREGQILPGRFISIAESSGLIVPIGAWVIGEVCRQMAVWRSRS